MSNKNRASASCPRSFATLTTPLWVTPTIDQVVVTSGKIFFVYIVYISRIFCSVYFLYLYDLPMVNALGKKPKILALLKN